jgi:DNA-binding XRE family transcriptional regulator
MSNAILEKRHQVLFAGEAPTHAVVPWSDYVSAFKISQEDIDEVIYDHAKKNDDGKRFSAAVIRRISEGESPVKVYREHLDLTQEELGAKLGVTSQYIGMIERGERALSTKLATKAAALFDVDAEDLEPWDQD